MLQPCKEKWQQQQGKKKVIRKTREWMVGYFNSSSRNLDFHDDYNVSVIPINTKENYAFVGVLSEINGLKYVYV